MIVKVPQEVICTCDYDYEIPDSVAEQGKEAVKEYIRDHYDEIPAGEIEPIESSYTLSEDYLDERVDDALDYYYENKPAAHKEVAPEDSLLSPVYGEKFAKIFKDNAEVEKEISKILEQENKYGVKIDIDRNQLIDKDHLDCMWYGGDVGSIQYKGYEVVIGAYGDIRADGKINGIDVGFKDKHNGGSLYQNLALDYDIDDKKLYELIESPTEDNYLTMENNNWFEFDLVSPSGEFIDLAGCDNVIDNNLLENFKDISTYLEYVDDEIQHAKILDIIKSKDDLDVIDKLENLCGDGTLSSKEYAKLSKPNMVEKIEDALWELMGDNKSDFSKASTYDNLAVDYTPLAKDGYDLWTANVYNCDSLYKTAIEQVKQMEKNQPSIDK